MHEQQPSRSISFCFCVRSLKSCSCIRPVHGKHMRFSLGLSVGSTQWPRQAPWKKDPVKSIRTSEHSSKFTSVALAGVSGVRCTNSFLVSGLAGFTVCSEPSMTTVLLTTGAPLLIRTGMCLCRYLLLPRPLPSRRSRALSSAPSPCPNRKSSQVKNYSPVYIEQTAAKNTGPAHGVGGLCECMRCFSSWKAAWAECTCAGAAR